MRRHATAVAPIREVIRGLGFGAETKTTRLVRACGAKMASSVLATNVDIDMAVRVQDNQAVAFTFAGHSRLSESGKIALLYQAARSAGR